MCLSNEEWENVIAEAHGWNPDRPRLSEADRQKKVTKMPHEHLMLRALNLIEDERFRQEHLKVNGRFPHTCADKEGLGNAEKLCILLEEVGEAARAVNEVTGLANDKQTQGLEDLRRELIQVAAVACAWVESLL